MNLASLMWSFPLYIELNNLNNNIKELKGKKEEEEDDPLKSFEKSLLERNRRERAL